MGFRRGSAGGGFFDEGLEGEPGEAGIVRGGEFFHDEMLQGEVFAAAGGEEALVEFFGEIEADFFHNVPERWHGNVKE